MRITQLRSLWFCSLELDLYQQLFKTYHHPVSAAIKTELFTGPPREKVVHLLGRLALIFNNSGKRFISLSI